MDSPPSSDHPEARLTPSVFQVRITGGFVANSGLFVNTKKWYGKGTDLWAEFGDEIPFG
jgi:hypothetical protein